MGSGRCAARSNKALPPRKDPVKPGPEMGVWCVDLESSVGNPLLISVKLRLDNWRRTGEGVVESGDTVASTGARTA